MWVLNTYSSWPLARLRSRTQEVILRGQPKLDSEKSSGVWDMTKHPCATSMNLSRLYAIGCIQVRGIGLLVEKLHPSLSVAAKSYADRSVEALRSSIWLGVVDPSLRVSAVCTSWRLTTSQSFSLIILGIAWDRWSGSYHDVGGTSFASR